jgi:diguanylate cyclase (GGDEF)-like protein
VAELTGRQADVWVDRPVAQMFADDTISRELTGLVDGQRRRVESTIRDTERHVEATLTRFAGGEVSISLHDITERLELLRQLEFRADHDILTGLPNRLYLERAMWQHDAAWHTERRPFAVIYIDIDDFKMVNDSLGHRLGDTLLAEVGRVFGEAVGPRGVLGRLGGDEYAVLMPGADLDEALALASELVEERLAEPVVIEGIEVLVRASAGVAASTADHTQGESLLQAADLALWDARTRGKGRIATFRSAMRAEASRKLHDANAVTSAARERAFRFDYQPIVDVSTGRAVAMEALMRWDSDGTLGGPDQFIPLAESLGELTRMLRDLIPTSLRDLTAWRRIDPDVKLAVNVHAAALADREFLDWLAAAVAAAGLPSDAVIVEVSERALVPTQADRHLATSRDAGVPVWIDDFGTGWSNLSVLDRLPVTGVKMARELVIDNSGEVKGELVSAVLRLAHAVGFVVTAEGVETTAQLTRLRAIGVTIVQGFLVGRPMPAAAVESWLLRHGADQAGVG